ncbi:hypothetical protein LTR09_011668 [Extremus antarcticus]|uniref:Uncharacterized protein n=1 Tax=Extremus antarcticus TaxID=702011 RepID=A0AAJ0G4D0_9PEZI|nr:hypothetical protein LTR09_011668 [Extremus antarcticus]
MPPDEGYSSISARATPFLPKGQTLLFNHRSSVLDMESSTSTDITHWRQPGHNILGFQHVDKNLKVDQSSETSHLADNGSQAAFAAGAEKKLFEAEFDSVWYRSFWTVDSKSQTLMASGINGQQLFVNRERGVVMAKTSSKPERTDWETIRLTIRAFKEFGKVLAG